MGAIRDLEKIIHTYIYTHLCSVCEEMLFVTQVFILKETSDESRVEVNRSKFIYMLFSFFFSRVTNDFRFFCPGELVLALKSSNLRGSVLLSMALFVSGEVLIGARAKRALL